MCVRSLQLLLSQHDWNELGLRDAMQQRIVQEHLPAPGEERVDAVGVVGWIDQTSVAKTEIGLGHYDGRHDRGLLRHMMLCQRVLRFVAEQTERRRGEKPAVDEGTGGPGDERDLQSVAAASMWRWDDPTRCGSHRLPPDPQRRRHAIPRQTCLSSMSCAVVLGWPLGSCNVIFVDGHYMFFERWKTHDLYYIDPRYTGPIQYPFLPP